MRFGDPVPRCWKYLQCFIHDHVARYQRVCRGNHELICGCIPAPLLNDDGTSLVGSESTLDLETMSTMYIEEPNVSQEPEES